MKKQLLILFTFLVTVTTVKSQATCATAIPASLGTTTASTSYSTTIPVPAHCQNLLGTESFLWYTYTSPVDTNIRVSTVTTANTGLDTRTSIFSGTCSGLTCVADGDDESAYLTIVDFSVTAGVTYYIVFDSYWGDMPINFTTEEYDAGSGGGGNPTQMITFTTQGFTGGSSRCVVDMNNDHVDDIVIPNGNLLQILYQSLVTPGTFTPQTFTVNGTVTNSPSWSIAGGDMNNDGYSDLIYGGGNGASLIMSNATGTAYTHYADGNYIFSQRTNVVDVDNNGVADAFVCHDVDANVWYESDGSGGFTHHQGGLGPNAGNYGSVWIDYDNDCDIDLFIAKCGADPIDQLHRNDGNGNYTSVGAVAGINDGTQNWSSAWADFDNDGDMDAFLGASSNSSGSHKLYRNNGDGTFTNITAGSGFDNYSANTGIENLPADFNNDGWVDVFGLGGLIMFNNGDMTFTASTSPTYSGATGDLNQDGAIDIVSGSTIYFNDVDTNNYLVISTIGTTSNKQGIGARITVNSALGSQIRDVRSAEAFSSMQTLNAHFGLGQDTQVYSVTICWPSGIIDIINNPTINSHLVVTEGSTVGVDENELATMKIFPNPSHDGLFNLTLPNMNNGTAKVEVLNMIGEIVFTTNISSINSLLDLGVLSNGSYFVRINNNNQFKTEKISIIR